MSERNIECNHCKKPVKVIYKEIVGELIIETEMCGDCPILQQKLHGKAQIPLNRENLSVEERGLCCGTCRTTLESVQTGNPLGCSECYAVFSDILVSELKATHKISPRLKKEQIMKKNQPLHIGKTSGKTAEIPVSSRLTALNEALNDAVRKENYEQAAWIRDQIKELKDKDTSSPK